MWKKTGLAALGVAGACAACCAIPVALPMLGGLSALGTTALGAAALDAGREAAIGAAALAFVAAAGGIAWWKLRRAAPACAIGCGASPTKAGERAAME